MGGGVVSPGPTAILLCIRDNSGIGPPKNWLSRRETKNQRAKRRGVPVSVIQTSNLTKQYGRIRALKGVSLHVEPGEVVGLLGANGAGKTTTFYMIVGLETPEAGQVQLAGRDITRLPMYLRARLGLGYLPQEPSVFRKMTAAENLLAVLETMGLRRREQLKRLEELLQEFGIEHVRNTRGDALSGGERRRTEWPTF